MKNKKRIVIISSISTLLILICLSLFLFLPRNFTTYFKKSNTTKIQLFNVVNSNKFTLNEEQTSTFFNDFKKARYVRDYFPTKTKYTYSFIIECTNGDIITFSQNNIMKNNKAKFIHVIGVPLNDIYDKLSNE